MMNVLSCIALSHNILLVAVAALMCVGGVIVTFGLFWRTQAAERNQKIGWLFLTSLSAGASIWSTHFIAILGYQPDVPVAFDPVLTIGSLFIAIFGSAIGLGIVVYRCSRHPALLGGALVGLAISGMHFTGMFAYRVIGVVTWNNSYILSAITLAVLFSAIALRIADQPALKIRKGFAIGCFVFGIVSLHFTAMTAFSVIPMDGFGPNIDTASFEAMGLCIALITLLVVGAGLSSYLIDSSTRSTSDGHVRHLALHDSLTGLPNRVNFNLQVDEQLSLAAARGGKFAVVGIDLDGFKLINEVWGHAVGDRTLQRAANLLKRAGHDPIYIARVGGDEFAAVQPFNSDAELNQFIERIKRFITTDPAPDEPRQPLSASIGVALFPKDGETREALISNADLALHRAKTDPARSVQFYDPPMGEAIRSRRLLADDLRDAMESGGLSVYYQPQTSIVTGEIIGYEALCRWKHPVRGFISPAEFVPVAEETGQILQLGEWVLNESCREAAGWTQPYKVAVNLSASQFTQTDLPRMIQEILFKTGLPPSRLELELTETAVLLDKTRSLHFIRQIKAMGVSIALDDFGTGYSSLSTLNTFPFDKIKLDRSFIEKVSEDLQSLAIVRAVMALGKSLGVPILAEGIETEEQLAMLRAEGCDEAQGYLLGRPMPASQLGCSRGPAPNAEGSISRQDQTKDTLPQSRLAG